MITTLVGTFILTCTMGVPRFTESIFNSSTCESFINGTTENSVSTSTDCSSVSQKPRSLFFDNIAPVLSVMSDTPKELKLEIDKNFRKMSKPTGLYI